MGPVERSLNALVVANNARLRRADPVTANPRSLAGIPWHQRLVGDLDEITREWSAFTATGERLPHIEDVLGEHQGNIGPWRVGVLRVNRASTRLARERFPVTLAALEAIPRLEAALWSVLEPGTELTEHRGPNAGVLRYHLGVVCPEGAALQVGDTVVPYGVGEGILFDDSAPHAAWNHGTTPRVTLFCEMERPLPGLAAAQNRMTQALMGAAAGRRRIPAIADSWTAALHP